MPEKFWSLEPGQVSLQGPDIYGMEKCKMSHSRDQKTFPAFRNEKGLSSPSWDLKSFLTWGNVKKINGWRGKCPGINSGIVNPCSTGIF
jgi:hypothetical protein